MKIKLLLTILLGIYGLSINGQTPNLQWAKQMGGPVFEIGYSIALDASGNVFTTGYFDGTVDFDPGAGVFNLTGASNDIFISKLDASGNFVWAKRMGTGSGVDRGYSIAIDTLGNVYTTGMFMATVDFDPGAGVFNLTAPAGGNTEIFISKLNNLGNFVWAKRMGGTFSDESYSITLDDSGNVFTTGIFTGTADFDPGAGIFNLASAGGSSDIFISKLDTSGNFVWAKAMGGTSFDQGLSITLDTSGNVYSTGSFQGTADFDPGAGIFNLTAAGTDIFISKLDASGNFLWANVLGGVSNDVGNSITTDVSGNVYTTGTFQGTADFDPGAGTFNFTSAGGFQDDIFISKLDASGNFVWAAAMGETNTDRGYGITTDDSGNVYTTGYFEGTVDFDPGAGVFNLTGVWNQDIFISKLNASGNFVWAVAMQGIDNEWGYSITLDTSGNVYTTGMFRSTTDFDPGAGTFNLTAVGSGDVFVHKLGQTPTPLAVSVTSANICTGNCATLTASANGGTSPYNYSWNPAGQTTQTIIACPTVSTTYSVTVMDANTNTATATSSVTVNPNPTASVSGNTTITSGNSTTLIATGGGTYQWYPSAGLNSTTGSTVVATSTSTITYCVIATIGNCSDTSCVTINVLPTGIQHLDNNNAFYVFPNPFSLQTTLQTDNPLHNATLTVYNCFGLIVAQIKNLNGQTIVFNRNNLASGLYFVRLTEENKIIAVDKLVIADK